MPVLRLMPGCRHRPLLYGPTSRPERLHSWGRRARPGNGRSTSLAWRWSSTCRNRPVAVRRSNESPPRNARPIHAAAHVDQHLIAAFLGAMAREFPGSRVLLIGSRARGDRRVDSDDDFVVMVVNATRSCWCRLR